jgi:hypothetical protein
VSHFSAVRFHGVGIGQCYYLLRLHVIVAHFSVEPDFGGPGSQTLFVQKLRDMVCSFQRPLYLASNSLRVNIRKNKGIKSFETDRELPCCHAGKFCAVPANIKRCWQILSCAGLYLPCWQIYYPTWQIIIVPAWLNISYLPFCRHSKYFFSV